MKKVFVNKNYSKNMEEITVENNLDKECSALGGLFQHIVDETKVGH